jgi:FkbM family methyltransferase
VLKNVIRSVARAAGFEIVRLSGGQVLTGLLMGLLREYGVNVALDIGAHHGEYGHFLRTIGYQGRLVSFEPLDESFAQLARSSAKDQNWLIHKSAVGSSSGKATIHVPAATTLASFLRPSAYSLSQFPNQAHVVRTETVEVVALDAIHEALTVGVADPRILLKLDTQGWDLEILKSAGRLLKSVVILQSELSVKPLYEGMTSYLEGLATLQGLGFELSGVFPVVRDRRQRVIELDCVMIKDYAS